MTYQTAKQAQAIAGAAHRTAENELKNLARSLSESLGVPEKGLIGLTHDLIKAQPEFKRAWAMERAAFERMRQINLWISKAFTKEEAAARIARREAHTA